MSTNSEWTILEKLLLTQAVYKYGENMWFQVARVLKQHGLIQPQQRQSDFFSQKNCQFQYYLLVESLEAEKQLYRSHDLKNDMPPVVRLARQLYTQRVDEVKNGLKKNEEEFGRLAQEIESIKSGQWDQKLKEQLAAKNKDTQLSDANESNNTTEASIVQSIDTDDTPAVPEKEVTVLPQHVTSEEYGIKRTTSETAMVTGSSMKRCRLDESKEEIDTPNEDQVLSTAIAVVSNRNNESKQYDEQPLKVDLSSNGNESENKNPTVLEPHATASPKPNVNSNESKESKVSPKISPNESRSIAEVVVEVQVENNSAAKDSSPSMPSKLSNLDGMNPNSMELDESVDTSIATNEEQSTVTVSEPQTFDKEPQSPQYNSHIPALPKISIPEPSHFIPLNPQHRLEQSVSPSSKLCIMTPDEEDFTSSETATPTSASTFEKKRANNDQRQKAWQKNINLLWQEIANHKNGTMFMNPIKKSYAPIYDKVVKQPLYLKTIKNRVRDGIVKTTAEFERDVVLMLTNSLMYNKEGTEMYLMALEMLDDVREQIRLFKSADGYSVSVWENSGESSNSQS